jgi:hypothetical protein
MHRAAFFFSKWFCDKKSNQNENKREWSSALVPEPKSESGQKIGAPAQAP